MAAFSYPQHHSFFLESVFFQTNPIIKNMSSSFMDGTNNNINSINRFSQLYSPEFLLQYEQTHSLSTSLDQHNNSNNKVVLSDNEPSLTQKQSTDSSIVVDKLESGEQVTQKVSSMEKKRKNANGSSLTNCATSKDGREVKSKRQKKCNVGEVKEEEKKAKTEKKDQKKVDEEPPKGYIHVRARRGQATDSHSLAERVRREKISERMKILQRLVPGCDKVTGKALMLDEIINYVQSLQNQVEFLSMKLASVNPLFYDFGMDMDACIIRPERLNSMVSPPPLPPVQQCSPTRLAAFAEPNTSTATTATTNFVTPNDHYNLIDGSSSALLQGQRPNEFSQDSGSLLWEMEEQRQKLLNPSGYNYSNLCSFP